MECGIEGKILKIVPGAAYQGKLYDQDVFLELNNRQVLELFDHKLVCPVSLVGKKVKVEISALESHYPEGYKMKKIRKEEKKLVAENGYEIFGEIIARTPIEKDKLEDYLVDVGIGFICLSAKKNTFELGDHVYAHASRLDITKIL